MSMNGGSGRDRLDAGTARKQSAYSICTTGCSCPTDRGCMWCCRRWNPVGNYASVDRRRMKCVRSYATVFAGDSWLRRGTRRFSPTRRVYPRIARKMLNPQAAIASAAQTIRACPVCVWGACEFPIGVGFGQARRQGSLHRVAWCGIRLPVPCWAGRRERT